MLFEISESTTVVTTTSVAGTTSSVVETTTQGETTIGETTMTGEVTTTPHGVTTPSSISSKSTVTSTTTNAPTTTQEMTTTQAGCDLPMDDKSFTVLSEEGDELDVTKPLPINPNGATTLTLVVSDIDVYIESITLVKPANVKSVTLTIFTKDGLKVCGLIFIRKMTLDLYFPY